MSKKAFVFLLLSLFISIVPLVQAVMETKAVIYTNPTCNLCVRYVDDLVPALEEAGITSTRIRDWLSDEEARAEVQELHENMAIPKIMRENVITVLDGRFIFEGYVPAKTIVDFLMDEAKYYKTFVYHLSLDEETYRIMNDLGQMRECPINLSIKGCDSERFKWISTYEEMLPLVVATGLLAGINPCSLGVLSFLVAILYTRERTKQQILKAGAVYLCAIFIVYLYVGLGLLQTLASLQVAQLFAIISAIIVIVLGLVNVKDFFWYGKGPSLSIPKTQRERVMKWVHKASIPAAAILGVLVGLLTFPCMGGIYLVVLGMLSISALYAEAAGYLVVYNVMAIVPAIAILLVASNERTVMWMRLWDEKQQKRMRLIIGIVMVVLGLLTLLTIS